MKINSLIIIGVLIFTASCTREQTPLEKWQQLKNANFAVLLKNAPDFIDSQYFDSVCGRLNDTLLSKKYARIVIHDIFDRADSCHEEQYELQNKELYYQTHFGLIERNELVICLKDSSHILVSYALADFDDLGEIVKEYLFNPKRDENLAEIQEIEINSIGKVFVSKGSIVLKTPFGFNDALSIPEWKFYFKILIKLKEIYFEFRNDFALKVWNIPYNELDLSKKTAVIKAKPSFIQLNFIDKCRAFESLPPSLKVERLVLELDTI